MIARIRWHQNRGVVLFGLGFLLGVGFLMTVETALSLDCQTANAWRSSSSSSSSYLGQTIAVLWPDNQVTNNLVHHHPSLLLEQQQQQHHPTIIDNEPFLQSVPDTLYRRTYYAADCGKECHAAIRALRQLGWTMVDDWKRAQLWLSDKSYASEFKVIQPWQRYNHLYKLAPLVQTSDLYWDVWSDYVRTNNNNNNNKNRDEAHQHESYDKFYLLETYRLHVEQERREFQKRVSTGGSKYSWFLLREGRPDKWIPARSPFFREKQLPSQGMIQRTICHPLSWKDGRHAMTIRVFILIASVVPSPLVYYQDGYVLIGSIEKKDQYAKFPWADTHVPMSELESYLTERKYRNSNINRPFQHVTDQFHHAISVFVDAFGKNSTFVVSGKAQDSFELLAADFVLDEDLNAYLVDIHTDTSADESKQQTLLYEDYYFALEKQHTLLHDQYKLLDELWEHQYEGKPFSPPLTMGQWKLAYANGWEKRQLQAPKRYSSKNRKCKSRAKAK